VSEDPPTNGKRAALAMDAVSLYARSSAWEGSAESTFFFDFDRDALPGGDQDRLAALLCGLMHYAGRRGLSFPGALAAARQDHARQRTTYQPGNAVRRAGPAWRAPAPGEAPLTGEVIAARPGRPAQYHVDFITTPQWLPETALAPASPFPQVTTSYGTFSSAFAARYCLQRTVTAIERACLGQQPPDGRHLADLDTIVTAMSGWSGLERDSLLRSFSEIVAERDRQLAASAPGAHPGAHPAALAAASTPLPPSALPEPADAPGDRAAVLPFRKTARRGQTGRR
jgi:hypothetical protein